MARMSVDDKARRDPRVLRLARLCGWSRREAFGALFDVWAVCYDRVNEFLPETDINETAMDGAPASTPDDLNFAEKLIEVGLGKRYRGAMIRVAGAEERIRYLRRQSALGRTGGLKSAETRRKTTKGRSRVGQAQASLTLEGSVNPPDTVPDSVSVNSPAPDGSTGPGVVLDLDRERMKRDLVSGIGPAHAKAFARVKQALGSSAMGPSVVDKFEQLRELLDEAPSLEGMRERCEYAIAIQEREAMQKRTLQYFGDGMWKRANFQKALTFELDESVRGKDPRVGRVEPSQPEAYPDGEIKL